MEKMEQSSRAGIVDERVGPMFVQFGDGPRTPSERAHLHLEARPISKTQQQNLAPPPAGIGARPSNGAMLGQLPDELLEEVLRRLPPDEPAELVRAALVSRRWCRLISGPGFRRRFREFHRSPPMLGMLCNHYTYDFDEVDKVRFIPTTAFCFPSTYSSFWFWDMRVLDARHGRVLCKKGGRVLAVWNPITDEVRELPFPQKKAPWTAAVLCSAPGPCDHLDCHQGPFLVVFVCSNFTNGNTGIAVTEVYTYPSDTAAWSEPVCAQQPDYSVTNWMGSALVGNALYFGNLVGSTALKYDLELRQVSLIQLPSLPRVTLRESRLTTTEDGRLGLLNIDDSKFYMWSRKDTHEVDAKWERRVIELKAVFPVDVDVAKLSVIGSGVGIILMKTWDEVYTVDLKTFTVKKVFGGTADTIIPYMSFYTPVLRVSATGEEQSSAATTC